VTRHTWPIDHPVPAAVLTSLVVLAIGVIGSFTRYRSRTTD
jgi:hypothetical protein